MSTTYITYSASESDQGYQIISHQPIASAPTAWMADAIRQAIAAGGSIRLADAEGCEVLVELHTEQDQAENGAD